jgi:hypothetical protein
MQKEVYKNGNFRLELIPTKRFRRLQWRTTWQWKTYYGNGKVAGISSEWYYNRSECVTNYITNISNGTYIIHDIPR